MKFSLVLRSIALLALPMAAPGALIGFNAEDGSSAGATVSATLGADFTPARSDTAALGEQYIASASNGGGSGPSTTARVASYEISFAEAGTYDLYARLYIEGGNADDDSLFYGNGFGTKNAGTDGDWITCNGLYEAHGSGAYSWVNLSEVTGHYGESGTSFSVPSAGTQTVQIGAREDGLRIDALAFGSTGTSFTEQQLDASVNLLSTSILSSFPEANAKLSATAFPLDLGAVLLDGESTVDTNSITLSVDGYPISLAPTDIVKAGATTTVSHAISSLSAGPHSASLVYEGINPSSGPTTLSWSLTVRPPVDMHVCIVGDSTVQNSSPRIGWGQVIAGHFNRQVEFDNRAVPGRSSKTFITEGNWANALSSVSSNDYVFIQFGHNDSHHPENIEATDASTEYKTYLQQYVDETRATGATPILVTPMYRRNFDKNGQLLPYIIDNTGYTNNLLPYATAMKEVAEENSVTCVDLFTASGELMQRIGDTACAELLVAGDITHWNEAGADVMASLVTREIAASTETLNKYVIEGSVPAPFAPGSTAGATDAPTVSATAGSAKDFALFEGGAAATVVYSAADAEVVEITATLFAEDVERVTGVLPTLQSSVSGLSGPVVLMGTLGRSPELDALVADGHMDVSAIQGGWEQYHIEVVENPWPNVPQALIIAGSDRRGTAYGAFSLSEEMGVSPWYWWADSAVSPRSSVYVDATPFTSKTPSVRYRGIFINDEDWGLQEWAEKNYESGAGEVRDLGPKSYAKIFELLLRLKANYCWPGMHPSTRAFNHYAENKVVANRYAIVMGSSHAEPMLRNNVDEWESFCAANGYSTDWNYANNKTAVYAYWEQRAIANGAYENVYTVGKRGIHDSGMVEGSSTSDKAAWLNTIFDDQRQILSTHVNEDVTQVGQIFVPYKEVLDIYDSGEVVVPNDVTLVWPDDNHGYIRRLSNPVEQLRSGGGGVYYHLSYWGSPRDYLWLCSTPPSLIWEELSKAYAYNCGRLWVINVGDIKPTEIGLEFSMRLAWDVNRYDESAQITWLTEWAEREFGAPYAQDIASLMNDYYRLGFERKPEQMNWKDMDDLSPSGPYPMFSHVHYGDEAAQRLAEYAELVQQANTIYAQLPADQQSIFYETVLYPLRGADGMNRKFLEAGKAYIASLQNRNSVDSHKTEAQAGYDQIYTETATYNALENGKWNYMMSAEPHPAGSTAASYAMPAMPSSPSLAAGTLGVAVEGRLEPAYLDASGITYQSLPGYISLNAASEYSALTGDMIVQNIDGKPAIFLPGSGSYAASAGDKGKAVYSFSVAEGGTYTLSFEINCPTVEDDSWYIQMDSGSAVKWNGLSNGGVWGWVTFNNVNLSAGAHTLTVYAREDGAAMASIKLSSSATVLVEDRAQSNFALPEFNARTRRSYFIDLFNTGTGSVNWQATSADPWVQLSESSGELTAEQRITVSIDWAAAPMGEALSSSIALESAGQTLTIPVQVWNPENALPLNVDFVEDNGVVSMEAENYSDLIPATDASWTALPNLGQGSGAMMISPVTAPSRKNIAQITDSSPVLIYDAYIRSAGTVTVSARFIPTLTINAMRGLRYAVSFDDETPQIVDMDRPSGTGSLWRRSVLRGHIDYTSTHTLNSEGVHQLKIWMVDPGVVLDRIEIQTGDLPYTYRGAPETALQHFGSCYIAPGETMILSPSQYVQFDSVTNNGTLTLLGSANADISGDFVNNGLLDIITWNGALPAGLANNGTIIDSLWIESITPSESAVDIGITGYAGHNYQLQHRSASDLTQGAWRDIEPSVAGNGSPITFRPDTAPNQQDFYRIQVSP